LIDIQKQAKNMEYQVQIHIVKNSKDFNGDFFFFASSFFLFYFIFFFLIYNFLGGIAQNIIVQITEMIILVVSNQIDLDFIIRLT
jgi:hypothetical protein